MNPVDIFIVFWLSFWWFWLSFLMGCWYLLRSRTQLAKPSKNIVFAMRFQIFVHQKIWFLILSVMCFSTCFDRLGDRFWLQSRKIDTIHIEKRRSKPSTPSESECPGIDIFWKLLLFIYLIAFWRTLVPLAPSWLHLERFGFHFGRFGLPFGVLLPPC